MNKRISRYTKPAAVRHVTVQAALRDGIDNRCAKQAARYGLRLLTHGASAARAITQAIRFAHWRSRQCGTTYPQPPDAA